MKNKYRLLLEQGTPQSIKFDETTEHLGTGLSNNCFPNFPAPQPYKDLKTGQTVLYRQKSDKEHVFVFNDGHYEVRDTGDANGKVTKTDKWTCYKLQKRDAAKTNQKIAEFIGVLKRDWRAKDYALDTDEMKVMKMVNLKNIRTEYPEVYEAYKANFLNPQVMTDSGYELLGDVFMFFPQASGGLQVEKGKSSIEKEQELLTTYKWQKEKPAQGNFVEVDLSNQASIDAAAKTYQELRGYVAQQSMNDLGQKVPKMIYKPTISLAQGTQVASELDGLLQAVTTSTVGAGLKENCRKLLKRYVDIAKGTISLDKNYINSKLLPVVKYCTNEKYTPFLKNKEIQALKYGGKYPWGTAQEIGAQSTLQEEVILRKLISKNLNEIKFNKKKI